MTRFEVEGRPLSWNKYYSGQHWAKRQATSNEWKWRVKAGLMKFRINKTPFKASVRIEFDVWVGSAIDCDNVVLKTYIDGLRDWGCLVNDDPKFVREIVVRVHTKTNSKVDREFVQISIYE